MKYKCKKSFLGSPNGCAIIAFEAGEEYDHNTLGDDLATVALDEGWIINPDKPIVIDPPDIVERPKVEVTVEMIKDCMTVKEMRQSLKDADIKTRAKKEDALAELILKHNLFTGE